MFFLVAKQPFPLGGVFVGFGSLCRAQRTEPFFFFFSVLRILKSRKAPLPLKLPPPSAALENPSPPLLSPLPDVRCPSVSSPEAFRGWLSCLALFFALPFFFDPQLSTRCRFLPQGRRVTGTRLSLLPQVFFPVREVHDNQSPLYCFSVRRPYSSLLSLLPLTRLFFPLTPKSPFPEILPCRVLVRELR